jgi:hypothetical protein
MRLPTLALLAIGTASAFHFSGAPLTIKMPSASAAAHHAQSGASAAAHRAQYPPRARHLLMAGSAEDDAALECRVDEPELECDIRRTVDGPWKDAWARFVLLRPGMSYSELKKATLQRNKLDWRERIPGTFRTIVITHAVCFIAAIPAVLRSDAILPRLVEAAAAGRVNSGLP